MGLFRKFAVRAPEFHENQDVLDIIDNLNNILNTKKDYGSPLAGFGVRDISAYCSRSDIARVIMEEIRYNVEAFEPRLRIVSIDEQDEKDPMRLSFRLQCALRDTARELEVVFDSRTNHFTLD